MELGVEDTGLPVADLEGRIVGVVIARAGRISTLILPGEEMKELLATEPQEIDMKRSRPIRGSGRSSESMSARFQSSLFGAFATQQANALDWFLLVCAVGLTIAAGAAIEADPTFAPGATIADLLPHVN